MSIDYYMIILERKLSTGEAWWLVGDETDALDLTVVVESNDSNKALGYSVLHSCTSFNT